MSTTHDIYQTVTNQIIAALEAGTPPWVCPWRGIGIDARPANATTGRHYRGVNVLLLNLRAMTQGFAKSRWLTFQQAVDATVMAPSRCVRRASVNADAAPGTHPGRRARFERGDDLVGNGLIEIVGGRHDDFLKVKRPGERLLSRGELGGQVRGGDSRP